MLAAGRVDVVIGTHRLLGADVSFRDLGLLVVDEEQRFGVAHKERLKRFRAHVDVLTMTATPIPRTLEMALTGIRQMSTVDTPPEDRQPVLTYVGSYDEGLALGAVRRELLREGQVFWVHNRVATIDRQAAWLQRAAPRGSDRRGARPDGRGRAREPDDALLGPRCRRPRLHDDHRIRTRRPEREHPGRRSSRHARAGPAVPAPGARRAGAASAPSRTSSSRPCSSSPRRRTSGSRRSRAHQALGLRVPDRAPGPRDPRRRQPPRRGTARAHRGGGVRRVLSDPPAVRRRAPGRADRGREGAADRPAGAGVRAPGMGGAGIPPTRAVPADLARRRITTRSIGSATETIDRYGALPAEVETLFAIASLRVACAVARRRGGLDVSGARAHPSGGARRRPCGSTSPTGSPVRPSTRRSERSTWRRTGSRAPISPHGWRLGCERRSATPSPSLMRPAGRLAALMSRSPSPAAACSWSSWR